MAKPKRNVKAAKSSTKAKAKVKAAKPARKAVARRAATKRPTVKTSSAARPAAPARPGWQSGPAAIPYLAVKDLGGQLTFCESVLGLKAVMVTPGPDGKPVHAVLVKSDGQVMLTLENEGAKAPSTVGGTPVTTYLFDSDVDSVASRATEAGGRVIDPPKDQFWGDRTCVLFDPEGHQWMVATHVKDVAPEDMHP